MPRTSRRTFLAVGAASSAGLAASLTACSDTSTPTPSSSPSSASSASGQPTEAVAPASNGGVKAAILADKPLLYVSFQDDADAKAPADESGNKRATKLVGSRWWADDALGTAAPDAVGRAWYSGVSDDGCSLALPGAAQWLAGAPKSGVSVAMWLCQEEANFNQTLLQLTSDGDETGWAFGLASDGTGFNLEGPGYSNTQPKFDAKLPKAWHHLAVTCTPAGEVVAYLDGKAVGNGSIGAFKGTVSDVLVGAKSSKGAPLTGSWSQYAIFGQALPAERVAAQYAAGVAAAEPAVRGVDAWFGGPAYYQQFRGAEVLADAKRFPVAEWWMNAFPDEFPTEKKYADGAVVLDPNVAPEGPRKAGIWVIRSMELKNAGTPGAETVGWLPADEADMDGAKMTTMAQNLAKVPSGMLAYSNFGTGVTISSIDRYRVRPLVDRPTLHQVSADLYSYCTKPKMTTQVAEAWGIDEKLVRRAEVHGLVVDRARAFLTVPRPVWGVVAVGHANTVAADEPGWASVPSADEVEGSIMSCLAHGASGILLFPQTFPDAKKAPTWQAGTSYHAGDTVADPKQEQVFWYARTTPKQGVDPNSVTDDSWLRWMPNVTGIRNTDHYARGVSERVARVKARLQTLAPVLNSRSVPHRFHVDLSTRYWPKAPDGYAYALVMQALGHDTGSYPLQLPAGTSASQVEVLDENRTLPVADGAFTDSFDAEWRHRIYRWKA